MGDQAEDDQSLMSDREQFVPPQSVGENVNSKWALLLRLDVRAHHSSDSQACQALRVGVLLTIWPDLYYCT